MIRRSLLAVIVFYCFSISLFSMQVPTSQPLPMEIHRFHQHVDVPAQDWMFVQAIWSVLLADQKTHHGIPIRMAVNEIINRCNAYLAITFDRPVLWLRPDTQTLARLLSDPQKILVNVIVDFEESGAKTVYYVDNEFSQPFEVYFNNNLKTFWNPRSALVPYLIAHGDVSSINRLVGEGLDINHRFPEYLDRTMLHLAVRAGSYRVIEFLLRNNASMTLHDRNGFRARDFVIEKSMLSVTRLFDSFEAQRQMAHRAPVPAPVAMPMQAMQGPTSIIVNNHPNMTMTVTAAPLVTSPVDTTQNPVRATTNLPRAPMFLNAKYMEGKVPSPIMKISDAETEPTIPDPVLVFRKLSKTLGYRGLHYVSERKITGSIHYRMLSKNPFRPVWTYNRNTIVLAGRGHGATVPEETDQAGRVILIAAPWQADEATTWLGENRDVMIIDALWDQFGMRIPDEDLGLVTTRRMAAFQLAKFYQMRNFMMLDDNIEHFYASNALARKLRTWTDFYHEFEVAAAANNSTILSAHSLDYQMLRYSLNADRIIVRKQEQAAKIFFVNMAALSPIPQNEIPWLFPLRRDVCGEDIFFQTALSRLGHSVDSISVESLAYWKNQSYRHAASNTIVHAKYWAAPDEVPRFAPEYHHFASRRLTDIYFENRERIERLNDQRRSANLPALTAENDRRMQRKRLRSNDHEPPRQISDEVQVTHRHGTPIRQKRQKIQSNDRPYDQKQRPQQSVLAYNFAKTINQILSYHLEFAFPAFGPFRQHQYEAIEALMSSLQHDNTSGFVDLPTGAGKTRVFLMWLAMALRTPELNKKHVAIFAPTVELVDQTYEAIKRFNEVMEPYGLTIPLAEMVVKVSTGNVPQAHLPHNKDFVGGKPQVFIFCNKSFENLIETSREFYDYFSMIIVDEFHTASNETLASIANYASQNDILFYGFSATPKERDHHFGRQIYYLSVLDAVRRGVLCSWENRSLGDWDPEDEAGYPLLAKAFNSELHPNGKLVKDTKSIIYVPTVKIAKTLAGVFRQYHIKAHSYTNENSKEEKSELLFRFALKENSDEQLNVLIAVNMLNMGFDGNVDTTVLGKNVNYETAVQIRGRGLRLDPLQPDKKALFVAPQKMFDEFDLEAPGEEPDDDIPSFFGFAPGPTHAPVPTPNQPSPVILPPVSPGQFRVTFEMPVVSSPTQFVWTFEAPQTGFQATCSPNQHVQFH